MDLVVVGQEREVARDMEWMMGIGLKEAGSLTTRLLNDLWRSSGAGESLMSRKTWGVPGSS
jgi:hypothetical protein